VASKSVAKPRLAVAVYAICADTDDEALDLSASVRMVLWKMFQGASIPVPPVQKARDFFQSSGMRMELVPVGRRLIIGSPARVRQGLEAVAADYGADEILVITITHDHGARRKSYELIGREFGLKRAS
jgi:alkanesulfonate monooxygenase SsuD/methylene tetrahydromethanopterin reductase-like flavin-dependent oxidoreductase (luciferase family)